MFRYLLLDHAVPATWRSLAAARFKADWPSGNAPTTRVRRLISRRRQLIEFALRKPKFECGVFLRPAQFSKRLSKDGDAALKFRVAC
jgi:hypothetical protein